MVFSSSQSYGGSVSVGSVGGSQSAGGWAGAAAGGVAASRPSTPLFGSGSHAASQGAAAGTGNFGGMGMGMAGNGANGGFGAGNGNGNGARARLAGLSVSLPALSEADESAAAAGGGDLDWSRGTTRAPAPSPEAGARNSGINEFQRGITIVVPSGDADDAVPGIAVAEEPVGPAGGAACAPPQSRPSSPAFGPAVTVLAPPRLNRENVAAALNAAVAKEHAQQQLSLSPAAAAVVPAGSVSEFCVDATAAVGGGGQQLTSAVAGFGTPAFGAAAAGEPDALDAIAEQDAVNSAANAAALNGRAMAFGGDGFSVSALPPAPQSTQRPAVSAFASQFGAFGFGANNAAGPFGGNGNGSGNGNGNGGFVANNNASLQGQSQGQNQAQWFGQPQQMQHMRQPNGWMTPQPFGGAVANAVPPQLQLQQRFISAQQQQAVQQQAVQQQHMQHVAAQQRFIAQQRAAAQAQAQAAAVQQQRAVAAAAGVKPEDTSALVPACGGRCRPQQARVPGLGVLTLTRTGSIQCVHCGQRAFTKLATVDTDPYALAATTASSALPASVPENAPLMTLTVSPTRPARETAVPHHKAGRPAAPVSYGAVRRAAKKPHRRTLSPDFQSAENRGGDENRVSDESNEVNARPTVGRNGSIGFGRALASALSHATPRCQGVGDGVTYASLKSRRTARRASALASSALSSHASPSQAVVRPLLSASFAANTTSSTMRPATTSATRRPTAVGARSGVVVTAALSAALTAATATAY